MLVEIGTQDLGTGTRTIITQVAAETLGLPMGKIKLAIGSNDLPPDAASGGSTTVGGVSVSTRRSTVNALAKLFEVAAPALWARSPKTWKRWTATSASRAIPTRASPGRPPARRSAPSKISEMGNFNRRQPAPGMNDQGVAGVQIADVSVDTETGIVKVNRYIAVQDCGLIVNPRLAESQIYGGIIMGICTALYEERVHGSSRPASISTPTWNSTSWPASATSATSWCTSISGRRTISAESSDSANRCAVAICAAIGNAVANAIGVRVPTSP